MPQRSIRFSERISKEVDTVSRTRGFASATAFIRYAVEQELSGRQEDLTGAEERIAATLGQVRKDLFRVARSQQALFAYVDTLAKALLTCVPEPPAEAKPQAVARAKLSWAKICNRPGFFSRMASVWWIGNDGGRYFQIGL